jgi:DNA repair protein RadA/Sms
MRIKFQDTPEFGTDITTIEIPAHLNERISTGIDWVDDAFGGEGLTPSMVTLFAGEAGAGKTTLAMTIASAMAEEGNLVVYNTAEESLHQLKRTYNRLGLHGPVRVGGETVVTELIDRVEALRKKNPGKRAVLFIDSLQCLDDGHFGTGRITSETATRSLEKLCEWAKENYTNVIAINQVTKGGNFAGSNKLRHMVDAMAFLGIEKKEEELKGMRKFEVLKNRFGGCGQVAYLQAVSNGLKLVATAE